MSTGKLWLSRTELPLFFVFAFLFYCFHSWPTIVGSRSIKLSDVGFGTDQLRVLLDVTTFKNSARTYLHPLYVLVLQFFFQTGNSFLHSRVYTLLFMQSAAAAGTLTLLYHYVKLLKLPLGIMWALVSLYLFSTAQMLYTMFLDAFIFSGFTMMLLHYLFFKWYGKNVNIFALAITGLISVTINITGYIQFLIRLTLHQWQLRRGWHIFLMRMCIVIVISLAAAHMLSLQQKKWFPGTTVFLEYFLKYEAVTNPHYNVDHYLNEWRFITFGPYKMNKSDPSFLEIVDGYFSWHTFHYVSQNMFTRSFLPDGVYRQEDGELKFHDYLSWPAFGWSVIFFGIFFANAALLIKRNHPLRWPLLICLIFNLLLHSFYGLYETWLYSAHFAFIYILVIAHGTTLSSQKTQDVMGWVLPLLAAAAIGYNLPIFEQISDYFVQNYPPQVH